MKYWLLIFSFLKRVGLISVLLLILSPFALRAQKLSISVSGIVKDKVSSETLPFVNITLKNAEDSAFVSGTITHENGLFTLSNIKPNDYIIEVSYIGYKKYVASLYVGSSSDFINIGYINIEEMAQQLNEVEVSADREALSAAMDKKTFSVDANISQSGGSVLQSMNSLPGITMQDGQVQLRGNNQVMVLIDGKQTAITGFGNQNGLDNIPASAVEKIEIINNPSAKYDANGIAGIINIVLRKEEQYGLNGKVGLSAGLGALWVRKVNLPVFALSIMPHQKLTPLFR